MAGCWWRVVPTLVRETHNMWGGCCVWLGDVVRLRLDFPISRVRCEFLVSSSGVSCRLVCFRSRVLPLRLPFHGLGSPPLFFKRSFHRRSFQKHGWGQQIDEISDARPRSCTALSASRSRLLRVSSRVPSQACRRSRWWRAGRLIRLRNHAAWRAMARHGNVSLRRRATCLTALTCAAAAAAAAAEPSCECIASHDAFTTALPPARAISAWVVCTRRRG